MINKTKNNLLQIKPIVSHIQEEISETFFYIFTKHDNFI